MLRQQPLKPDTCLLAGPFARALLFPLLLLPLFLGCQKLDVVRLQNKDKNKDKKELFETQELKVEYIGDKSQIVGNSPMKLYGVGLVTGLDNTGEDPPPSSYRSTLVREMERRGVKKPNEILKDPSTALVLVEAYLNADVKKGEPFDVIVSLPPNSTATSLAGGWLMETYLWEKAYVQNVGELTGRSYGTAEGPILVSMGLGEEKDLAGVLKRGKVLAGGKAKKERKLGIFLRSDVMGVRNSKQIADRIGERFSTIEKGSKKSMAIAKDNKFIELDVHPIYKQNYDRYMQVIRNIAFRETPLEQRDRQEKLKEQILNPDMAALAALRFEAIGKSSVPFLKTALNNPSKEVRFYAAEALAYLEDESGVVVLAEMARDERAFRVFALAAMSALEHPDCFTQLHKLLNENSPETRYGAFRALWTIDPNDPYIRGKRLNDQFNFHPLATKGEPMVHLTRHKVAEIVIFGQDQQLSTPIALSAGSKININAQAGADRCVVSRFEVGKEARREVSLRIADIIVAAGELGATYPDIAAMLTQAKLQHNTPGRVEIDALPAPGRLYYRTEEEQQLAASFGGSSHKEKAKIGRDHMSPNQYPSPAGDVKDERADPYAEPEEPEPKEKTKKNIFGVAGSTTKSTPAKNRHGKSADKDEDQEKEKEEKSAEKAPSMNSRILQAGFFKRSKSTDTTSDALNKKVEEKAERNKREQAEKKERETSEEAQPDKDQNE
ncbi:MAG: flagellar basal body P-ring protein FlgI [Planctomycetales bacterium]